MMPELFLAAVVAMATLGWCQGRQDLAGVLRFQQGLDTNNKQQLGFKPRDTDKGYVQDCSKEGAYFNISWSPKEINPTRPIYFEGDVISPMSFDKGKVTGSLFFEGTPMVSINRDITCQEISDMITKALPSHKHLISCPIKLGQRLQGSYVFPNTEMLIGYDGTYQLKGELFDDKGKQLLCVEIDVTILPF